MISFKTTAKGKLSHLSYIFRKPGPLGMDFNTVSCYVTWGLVLIEIHINKEDTNNSKYHIQLGTTADCTKRMMEATKEIGQRDVKVGTKDFFDSWFSSKN